MSDWFEVTNVGDVASPALLLYPNRIRENIRRMIRLAGSAVRLRPHIKTHKLPELVRMQLEEGITKFKCATIAEAEMAAGAGAKDVLIAYPMVGPNMGRLREVTRQFPDTKFLGVADDAEAIRSLAKVFADAEPPLELLLDMDCGQHRTGVEPGASALDSYRLIASLRGLRPGGLHVYDGHIVEPDPNERAEACEAAFVPVSQFCDAVRDAGLPLPRVVAGGTPTFPVHARRDAVECSPGTCVLWDFDYAEKYADLDFLVAALVLTRVISKPASNRLCLDLGHKAIAAEKPHPRVKFLNLPDAVAVSHSEEHLVVESSRAGGFGVGDCHFGVPRHICPTVALYSEAVVIREGRAVERWRVTARERRISI